MFDITPVINVAAAALGIGFLIFIHELGHFIAAKRVGVRVETFSLGFGPRLLGFRRGETDYRLSLVPLGGYVKMAGEGPEDEAKGEPWEFGSKSIGQRAVVFSAGVTMNALFALLAFFIVFRVGVQFMTTEVGPIVPGTSVYDAGLREGDVVTAVNGTRVQEFGDIRTEVAFSDLASGVRISYRRGGEAPRDVTVYADYDPEAGIPHVGLMPAWDPVVDSILKMNGEVPAKGLRPGDRILAVGGVPVKKWTDFAETVEWKTGVPTPVRYERDGKAAEATVTPVARKRRLTDVGATWKVLPDGVAVDQVTKDGAAERAGLAPGDVLLTWEGKPVGGLVAILRAEEEVNAGTEVAVTYRRDSESRFAKLAIDDAAARREVDAWGIGALWWGPQVVDHVVPGSPADAAGVREGDVLLGLDGERLPWAELKHRLTVSGGRTLNLQVLRDKVEKVLPVTPAFNEAHRVAQIGVAMAPAAVVVGAPPLSPAAVAGLRPGDRVVAADGHPILRGKDLDLLLAAGGGKAVTVIVERGGSQISVGVTPVVGGIVGIVPRPRNVAVVAPDAGTAMMLGVSRSWMMVKNIFILVRRLFAREVAASNIGGPVMIFQASYSFAQMGWTNLLSFLAIVSINLAVINAFPIPILDGGHLFFLLIEKVRGAPLPLRAQTVANYVGLVLILALLLVATSNDLARIFRDR